MQLVIDGVIACNKVNALTYLSFFLLPCFPSRQQILL
jgi:hypothetical protein